MRSPARAASTSPPRGVLRRAPAPLTGSAGVSGTCLKGGPLPFSGNTSDAGACCALCFKFKDVTTSNPTACANWTYNSAPTVAPFFTCELHAEGATTTNATTCTSGMPGPGPCKVDSDCNGGK